MNTSVNLSRFSEIIFFVLTFEVWDHFKSKLELSNVNGFKRESHNFWYNISSCNGICRDREVVMRGMDHRESAQKLIDAYRIHYNFVRGHSAIGKTPAEQAGIKLELGKNKIESLIKMASKREIHL